MSQLAQSLSCAQCGGSPLKDNRDGTITCPYCGSAYAHPERVCPRCETVNELGALRCFQCGETLRESCPRCGTVNWAQATHCQGCGAALDVLERIAERRAQTTQARLAQAREDAPQVKQEEEQASQARLQEMWERDNARLQAIAADKARRQKQERLLWVGATSIILVCLLVVIAVSLLSPLFR